jgi:phospholipid/cholesterol/gamma-HCH transport system permease protein
MGGTSATLGWFRAWGRMVLFGYICLAAAMSPAVYTARLRTVAARQVYFTAWQVLPVLVAFAALLTLVLSQIILVVTREYALGHLALDLMLRSVVLELVPLLTALFVALRSGSAITTEVALMRVTGELDTMHLAGIDPFEREFLPRIIASTLSVFALTVVTCLVAMACAYLVTYGSTTAGFAEYTRTASRALSPGALLTLGAKCITFGALVAVIPISAALDATRDPKSAPVMVMGGMVRLFFALGAIELGALAARYF